MWWKLLSICCFLPGVLGHGHLIVPAQRASLWRTVPSAPVNHDDNGLNCGGFAKQFEENKGRCGLCGDAWDLPEPRPHEDGGRFGRGYISAEYLIGDIVDITVNITANHHGWFEMRLCPHDNIKEPVTQQCLNDHVLLLADADTPLSAGITRYHLGNRSGIITVQMKLPDRLSCEKCVLQWKYRAGNSWGCDTECCIGCGKQEHFYNCADVRISSTLSVEDANDDDIDDGPGIISENQKIRFLPDDESGIEYPSFTLTSHHHHHHTTQNPNTYQTKRANFESQKEFYKVVPYPPEIAVDLQKQIEPYPPAIAVDQQKLYRVSKIRFVPYSAEIIADKQNQYRVSKIRFVDMPDNESMDRRTLDNERTDYTDEFKRALELGLKFPLTCIPTAKWVEVAGMDVWCKMNCPTCPKTHCLCY